MAIAPSPRDFTSAVALFAHDLQTLIEESETAFECLIWKAVSGYREVLTDEADVVGSAESGDAPVDYEDPVMSKAMEVPQDLRLGALDDASGDSEEALPMTWLYLAEPGVPRHSVIRYDEVFDEMTGDTRAIYLYVMGLEPIGRAGVGAFKYLCIPFSGGVAALPE